MERDSFLRFALVTLTLLLSLSFSALAAPTAACTACHDPNAPEMQKRLAPVNPTECIDCHLNEARDFNLCPKATTTFKLKGNPPSTDHQVGECARCHSSDYIFAPEQHKPTDWSQVERGVTCLLCHLDHSKGERAGDRKLLACEDCHSALARGFKLGAYFVYNPQAEFHGGKTLDFLETPGVPNKIAAHTCVGCHMPLVEKDRRSHYFYPTQQPDSPDFTCGQAGCHTGKGEQYTDLARGWQREIDKALRLLGAQLSAKKALSASSPANLKHYQIAKYEHDMVLGDRSFGVHNIDYARHLLADARQHLTEMK